jgi:hypothetical protein
VDEAAAGAPREPRHRLAGGGLWLGLAIVAAVVLWGGYGRDWRWTGFAHRALLWDWLHVALLPLAVAVAPLWLRHGHRLGRLRHLLLECVVVAFALLVVLGYMVPLHWTGFPGNTLWDWLELLVLPLAVALAPVWVELSRGVRRVHRVVGLVVLALLVVALTGGYGYGWRWTGFEGNTLFDWLQLLVAPLLLPLVVVPFVAEWTTAVMARDGPARDPTGVRHL